MFGQAIAEFEFTLTFADAPIDRFARGDAKAMTVPQKKGALVFFGKGRMRPVSRRGRAVQRDVQRLRESRDRGSADRSVLRCWSGEHDFRRAGQGRRFRPRTSHGAIRADRYKFRTSPLRNVALQPAFFHNGALRGWRTRFAITWTSSHPHASTIPSPPAWIET